MFTNRYKFDKKVVIALLLFGIVIKSFSQSYFSKANELYKEGKLFSAIENYKLAALNGENPVHCYFNIGNAYYQIDSLPQALVYYRLCINSAPDFFKSYPNLAVVYFSLKDYGACISTLLRALKIEPENQKSLLILGSAYRDVKDLQNAVIVFEKLKNLYPHLEEPYIQLGEIYYEIGDFEEAQKWLHLFPAGGKNIDYVNNLLADIAQKNNDNPKALLYLQNIFSNDKSKQWVLYKIIELQDKSGNDLVAFETARDGMRLFPDFPDIALLAGNLAFRREKYEDAEYCYTAAYRTGSASAVIGLENVRKVRIGKVGKTN